MTKTQIAISAIEKAAHEGKSHREAAEWARTASGLNIYAEGPVKSDTAGPAYCASLKRCERWAYFNLYANGRNGKWGRLLGSHSSPNFSR